MLSVNLELVGMLLHTFYDDQGVNLSDPTLVEQKFVKFVSTLLVSTADGVPCPNSVVIKRVPCLTSQQKNSLIQEDTQEEIITAIKDMPIDKAPGVDGFPIEFYTSQWNTVKTNMMLAK